MLINKEGGIRFFKVSNRSQHCYGTPSVMSLLSTSLHLTYSRSILAITSHKVRTLVWVVCRWRGSLIFSMLPHGIRQLDTLTCSSSIWWQPLIPPSPTKSLLNSLLRQCYFRGLCWQKVAFYCATAFKSRLVHTGFPEEKVFWNNGQCSGLGITCHGSKS